MLPNKRQLTMLQRHTIVMKTTLSKHLIHLTITKSTISIWIVLNLHINHIKITKTNVVFDVDLLDHVSTVIPCYIMVHWLFYPMNATLAYSLQSLSQYCVATFLCFISLTRLAYGQRLIHILQLVWRGNSQTFVLQKHESRCNLQSHYHWFSCIQILSM